MQRKDFYSSLSELMSNFLNLKSNLDKESKNKCLDIYKSINFLKANTENENEFKNNCIIFIEKIMEKNFNISQQNMEISIKNIYNIELHNYINQNNIEKENNQKTFENKNNPIYNKNIKIIIGPINNNCIINLNNNKNKIINQQENKDKNYFNNKNNKLYSNIDELLSKNFHLDIINNIIKIYKEIKGVNEENNKIILVNNTKQLLNNLFNKLKEINDKINSTKNKLDEIYFSKYFTLLFSVYPFFSKKQKEVISFWPILKDLKNNQLCNLYLIKFNEIFSDLIDNILLSNLDNAKKEEKLNSLNNLIFRISPEDKSMLYHFYLLFILFKIIIRKYNQFYIFRAILAFKLHFLLSNASIFSFTSQEFDNIYNDLFFIKKFFSNIYKNEIKEPNLINVKNNELIYDDNELNGKNNNNLDISLLFDEKDNKKYEKIMNPDYGIISHFYNIREFNVNQLIDEHSFYIKKQKEDFLNNIVSLINEKTDFIRKNFNQYKLNLINLEKEIYSIAKRNLIDNKSSRIINQYSPKTDYKKKFDNFDEDLRKIMPYKFKNSYKLIPMGSLTEFLSLDESDLDLYLYIEDKKQRNEIFRNIYESLLQLKNNTHFVTEVKQIISQRLCLLTVVYKGTNIDLSFIGYPPYIHSLLYREYSLLDPRLPMIGLAIKYLKKILVLGKEWYLNSFSWMNLLVIFLQDIINPPILPKLYSNKDLNKIFYTEIEYGNNKKKYRSSECFFNSLKKETVPIPDCIFNKNKIIQIYKNTIGRNPNKLSCAETFLKFLEFIIFYFKYDTLYAECSIDREGFYNMDEIKNLTKDDFNDFNKSKYNLGYYNYFTKKYLKLKDRRTWKKIREGFILIRDPVDNNYNPGQAFRDVECFEDFINELKYGYSILLSYGSFQELEERIKQKKNRNNI